MFPSLVARGKYVAETNFAARKQNMFLSGVKNTFASRKQRLLWKHMFPSLAAMETLLTRFQYCSLNVFPATTGKQQWLTAKKGKKESNWKNEKRELLIALYDCCGVELMRTA